LLYGKNHSKIELLVSLNEVIRKIRSRKLRRIVHNLVKDPKISLQEVKEKGISIERSPAGKSIHHCYPRGLIDHIIATSNIALTLCDVLEKVYEAKINRDYVLTGVILHDIYKSITYVEREESIYGISPLGEKLDHLSLLLCELYGKVPLDLLHIIASHHGETGPIRPHTLEALVVHLADVLDSTLNKKLLSAARYLAREHASEELEKITAQQAVRIILAKQKKGPEGVRRELRRVKGTS
jgi:7,8-dihydroneopterin 2',3'-cyclic phosphate phosphodiesterase